MKILAVVVYQLFPFPWLLRAQHLLSRPCADRDTRAAAWTAMSRERLLGLVDEEWDRAKALDEKLFKLTAVLTVAVTAASAVARPLIDSLAGSLLQPWVFGLLLYAIVHLFIGALMGFSGLRPKERAGYGPDFALSVQRRGKSTSHRLAEALKHYEVKNLLRSNEAVTANMAIRNGVMAFALALMLSMFAPTKQPEPKPVVVGVTANFALTDPTVAAINVPDEADAKIADQP